MPFRKDFWVALRLRARSSNRHPTVGLDVTRLALIFRNWARAGTRTGDLGAEITFLTRALKAPSLHRWHGWPSGPRRDLVARGVPRGLSEVAAREVRAARAVSARPGSRPASWVGAVVLDLGQHAYDERGKSARLPLSARMRSCGPLTLR